MPVELVVEVRYACVSHVRYPATCLNGNWPVKVGETVRYSCGDCQVVFDLCVASHADRATSTES
jgi:hypothetical protein